MLGVIFRCAERMFHIKKVKNQHDNNNLTSVTLNPALHHTLLHFNLFNNISIDNVNYELINTFNIPELHGYSMKICNLKVSSFV